MVAIVTGAGLGLLDTTANQAKGPGIIGDGKIGLGNGSSAVNLANGNLILQYLDENLSGYGSDLQHLRTYNSQGTTTDVDSDRWRWLGEKRVILQGTLNTAGSTVTRTTGDGHETVYSWNGSAYVPAAGEGVDDTATLKQENGDWVWIDGTTKIIEKYSIATGWISSSRDSSGNGLDYLFENGLLERISDAVSGQTLDLIYDSSNRLLRLDTRPTPTGASTQQVHYGYDELGRLRTVKTDLSLNNNIDDGNVYTTTYTYELNSTRVASVVQSDGTSVFFTYVNSGGTYKVETVTDHYGTTRFTYGIGYTEVTNGAGNVTRYTYDSQNRLTRVASTAVNGKVQSADYLYDANDNVTRVTDGEGNIVNYDYDSKSNLEKEYDAMGNTIKRTYVDNRMVTETRYATPSLTAPALPETTRFVYDAAGRLRFTVSAEGRVSENRYDKGLITHSIQYAGGQYSVASLGVEDTLSLTQLEAFTAGQDLTKTQMKEFVYDLLGNLSKTFEYTSVSSTGVGILNANAMQRVYVYDQYSNLQQTISRRTSATGTVQSVTLATTIYDGMGRATSETNGTGTTVTTYNNGSITQTNSATRRSVVTSYNTTGQITAIVAQGDGQTRSTSYGYDAAGRQVKAQDDYGVSYTFYDAAGRVSYKVNPLGAVVGFTYYKNGRLEQEKHYATKLDISGWTNLATVTVNPAASVDDRFTTYVYDKAGRLSTTTEEFGSQDRITTTVYDGVSRVTKNGVSGRETRYFYDKDGRNLGSLNAEGYVTENVYDAAGRLTTIIRYGTKVTSNTFDVMKAAVSAGAKLSTHYFYDTQGRQVATVNEQGFLTETVFDVAIGGSTLKFQNDIYSYYVPVTVAAGETLDQIRTKAGADKQVTKQQFDRYGRLVSIISAATNTVESYTYNAAGRMVNKIITSNNETGAVTHNIYNAFDQVTGTMTLDIATSFSDLNAAIDQYGKQYEYDRLGRRVAEYGPELPVGTTGATARAKTLFFYDAAGQLAYTVNSLGEVSASTYNAFGQLASVRVLSARIDLTNLTTSTPVTDVAARVAAVQNDLKDRVVQTSYNLLGSVASSRDAENRLTTYGYNNHGDVVDIFSPTGTTTNQTTQQRLVYDNLGRVKSTANDFAGINATTSVGYDGFGRVILRTDANGKKFHTAYEENGRKVRTRDDGYQRSEITTYDAFGRVLTVTDGLANTTTYSYDDVNRKTTVLTPEGVELVTWKGRSGQTLKIRDGNGNETNYTYNKDGQLKTTVDALTKTTITNTYDNGGRLFETVDANNNVVRFYYDAANRVVEKVVDPSGLNIHTRYEFDGQGRQISVTEGFDKPEAVKSTYEFYRDGRIKQAVTDPDGLKISTTYTYDNAGNTVRVARGTVAHPNQQVVKYVFDALGRKSEEIIDPDAGGLQRSTKYFYDKNNNLIRVVDAGNNATLYAYNAFNQRVLEVNPLGIAVWYNYDANGRVIQQREYANKVAQATLTSWAGVIPSTAVSTAGVVSSSVITESDKDRRTLTAYDKNGRMRFTLTTTEGTSWAATENVLDKQGNIVETRRFDILPQNTHLSSIISTIKAEKVVTMLKGLGYKDTAWGDATTSLGNTRRTFFAFDAANRLRFTINAAGHLTENVYDAAGNISFQTQYSQKPNALNGNYSLANILAQRVAAATDRTIEYRYDAANRLVDQFSPSVTITASNNTAYTGRLKTHTNYNALGQVTSRVEGTIVLSNNAEITVDQRTTSYRYNKAGNQTHTILAGWYDTTDQRVYQSQEGQSDRFQRITEVTYDALGNAVRNKITTAANTFAYQYKAYDAAGRELYDVDTLGFVSGKTYDAQGNVKTQVRYSDAVKVTVKAGNAYWSTSEINALVASDALKRTITHNYDAAGRKIQTLMPTTINNYDATLAATQNPVESSSLYYSSQGETTYEYNSFGDLVLQKERVDQNRWNETYHYYDNLGRKVVSAQLAGAGSTEYYVTRTDYDTLGNVLKTSEFANKYTLLATDVMLDKVPTVVGSNTDRIQVFSYDAMGHALTVTRQNVDYITQSGAAWGNLVTDATVVMSRSTYNAFGEVVRQYDALGEAARVAAGEAVDAATTKHAVQVDYDNLGKATTITESKRLVAGTAVDPFRNQATEATPTTTFIYDAFGNVRSTTYSSAQGRGAAVTTRNTYDHNGNRITSTDGEGNVVNFGFDVNGRAIVQKQAINVSGVPTGLGYAYTTTRIFEYDSTGRQTLTFDVSGANKVGVRQVYNAFGEVVREEKIWGTAAAASGLSSAIVSRYEYDDSGRIKLKQGSDGYTYYYYDLKGNASRVVQAGVDNVTTNARITETHYDVLGNALVQRLPYSTGTHDRTRIDPKIVQAFDRWGNIVSSTNTQGGTTTYAYNYANQLTKETSPETNVYDESNTARRAAVQRSISYDILGRAGKETHTALVNGVVLSKNKSQFYDRAGNVVQTVDASGIRSDYAYDIHGNKVGARNGVGTVTVSDYNLNGQVTKQTVLRQADLSVTHSVPTQYGTTLQVTTTEQAYNGNNSSHIAVADKGVVLNRYSYDQAGRQYAQFNSAGQGEYYKYDAFNQMELKSDISGRQTKYVFDELGNKKSEQTLMSVAGKETYVYGTTITATAQEGSVANKAMRPETVFDYYNRVQSQPYGTTDYVTVYANRDKEVVLNYITTPSAQRGSEEIIGKRMVEYVYGTNITTTAGRDSVAIMENRSVYKKVGTQIVQQQPGAGYGYTTLYGTKPVQVIDYYATTTTRQTGSEEIWAKRDVEYVYGTHITATEQRGSVAITAYKDVTYQSGTVRVTNLPASGSTYTTVYAIRQVEYQDGTRVTPTAERGSTPLYRYDTVEYVYGYHNTATEERGSVAVKATKTESYIHHYEQTVYGQTAVWDTRTVEYISHYNTPIYRTRIDQVLTGYTTPIYRLRDEQYVAGYDVAVFSVRQEAYISGYNTPIYRIRTEDYFTNTYKTPVYKTVQQQYITGYEVDVYGYVIESQFTGTYRTPDYRMREESYGTGTYKTPVYGIVQEQYVAGYDVPVYKTVQVEYIKDYTTPIYAERTVYNDTWVGNSWEYSKQSYKIGQLDRLNVVNVTDQGVMSTLSYDNGYNDFGQLKQEVSFSNPSSAVTYDYWENGLLQSKTDQEAVGSAVRKISSSYRYDSRGLKTQETHTNVDTLSRTVYGITDATNTNSTQTTHYTYDELGRLTNVRAPQANFATAAGSRATADLKSLSYNYDEWGNRRAIASTYRKAGATQDTTETHLYAYDAEGRTLVADAVIRGVNNAPRLVAASNGGIAYRYDDAGRLSLTEWFGEVSVYGNTTGFYQTENKYNDLGLVEKVESASSTRAGTNATHLDASTVAEALRTVTERYTYDNRGFRTVAIAKNEKVVSSYRDDGQITSQETTDHTGKLISRVFNYDYSASGDLRSYKYTDGTITNTYNYYYTGTYTGSQVSTISVSSTQKHTGVGTTHNTYDNRGRLTHSTIEQANPAGTATGISHKYFAYNAEGRIVGSLSTKFGVAGGKTQSYFYSNSNPLAEVGDESVNIVPINTQYKGGNTPGTYALNVGDTLSGIAQALFGDGSMWYVLADANALNMGPTDRFGPNDAGRTLRVPNINQALRNDSLAFKPYSSTEIIGDLTPTPEIVPPPPPKSGGGCGIAQIVMIAIIACAAIVTAGAAAGLMGAVTSGGLGGAMSLGASVMAGTSGLGAAAAFGAAAAGGFVGSVAGQLAGKSMGIVDHFSLRQAVSSGLKAGATAAVGSLISQSGNANFVTTNAKGVQSFTTAGKMTMGATSYGASYISNKATGLETHFNWTDMAVATVSSGISGKTGNGTLDAALSTDGFASNFASNMWGATVSSSLSRLTGRGEKQDWGAMANDAFGNALASEVIKLSQSTPKPPVTPTTQGTTSTAANNASVQDALVQSSVENTSVVKDKVSEQQSQAVTTAATKTKGGFDFTFDLDSIDYSSIDPIGINANLNAGYAALDNLNYRFATDAMWGGPAGNGDTKLYQKLLTGLSNARDSSTSTYDYNISNASSGIGAVFGVIGKTLNNAGYDIAQSVVGLGGLITDSNLRSQVAGRIGDMASYIWDNPVEALNTAYNDTSGYISTHSIQEMGEDSLRFVAGGFATAGMGKAAGSLGTFSLNSLKNSTVIFRPMGGTFNGSIGIPNLDGMVYVTTVTKEMSNRFQGMGYLDPRTNTFINAPTGTMAVDHIFPTKQIVKLDGFNTLTKQQMTNIIQDIDGFGNLQPLPKSLNSSKGSLTNWSFYRKVALDTDYSENLSRLQIDIARDMQNKIYEYQKINLNGKK